MSENEKDFENTAEKHEQESADQQAESQSTEAQKNESSAFFVADPFSLNHFEVTDAQEETDELNLGDEDLEELTDAELEQLEAVSEAVLHEAAGQDSEDESAALAGESEASAQEEGLEEAGALGASNDEEETSSIAISELRASLQAEADAEDDFQISEDNGQLDHLANVMAEETKQAEEMAAKAAAELAEWAPDAEEAGALAAAQKLAAEIAEDQALAAELAREAEEAEKHDPELAAALPHADETGNLDIAEVASCIEAILFMTDKPVSAEKLQEMLGPDFPLNVFQEAITVLMDRYKSPAHGVEVVEVAKGYQLRTKPGRAALVKKLAKVQVQRLSSGGMECLAIVAYRQPVMKEDIDKIRGVDSSYFIRGLLDKKLIKISGRSELPGRPMLYSTTDEFLQLFGLKDLSALPSLREIEQMVPASQSANPEDEDPRVKEMRRLVGQMKADTSTLLNYDPREDEKLLKEIKERVQSIPSSTPYLDEQKAQEKAAAEAAKAAAAAGETPHEMPNADGAQGQLGVDNVPSMAESAAPMVPPQNDAQSDASAETSV